MENETISKLYDCIDEMQSLKGLIMYHNTANEVIIKDIHEKNYYLNNDEIYGLSSLNDTIKEKLEHFYNNLFETVKTIQSKQKQIKA